MNDNQSKVKNLLKSTLERGRLKLLSELKLVYSAGRLFDTFMARQAKNWFACLQLTLIILQINIHVCQEFCRLTYLLI